MCILLEWYSGCLFTVLEQYPGCLMFTVLEQVSWVFDVYSVRTVSRVFVYCVRTVSRVFDIYCVRTGIQGV